MYKDVHSSIVYNNEKLEANGQQNGYGTFIWQNNMYTLKNVINIA